MIRLLKVFVNLYRHILEAKQIKEFSNSHGLGTVVGKGRYYSCKKLNPP